MAKVQAPAPTGKGHVSTLRTMLRAFRDWRGTEGDRDHVQETLLALGDIFSRHGFYDSDTGRFTAKADRLMNPRLYRSARKP